MTDSRSIRTTDANPGDVPIYGMFAGPTAGLDAHLNPMPCLAGCITDHVRHAVQGLRKKMCHAERPVAVVKDSMTPDLGRSVSVSVVAETVGAARYAGIELHIDTNGRDHLTFDPSDLRRLA